MTGWKENMGMSQDTGLVKIYAPMSHKETWQQEADEKNYKSTRRKSRSWKTDWRRRGSRNETR